MPLDLPRLPFRPTARTLPSSRPERNTLGDRRGAKGADVTEKGGRLAPFPTVDQHRSIVVVAFASGPHSAYAVLVVVHVLSAVVGFGSVALEGVYGFGARRPQRPAAHEELARFFASPSRARLLIWPVPAVGIAAVLVEPHGKGMGQAWVIAALVLWIVEASVVTGVVAPAERALRAALATSGAPGEDHLASCGARVAWGALSSDVMFVIALGLMVFQP